MFSAKASGLILGLSGQGDIEASAILYEIMYHFIGPYAWAYEKLCRTIPESTLFDNPKSDVAIASV